MVRKYIIRARSFISVPNQQQSSSLERRPGRLEAPNSAETEAIFHAFTPGYKLTTASLPPDLSSICKNCEKVEHRQTDANRVQATKNGLLRLPHPEGDCVNLSHPMMLFSTHCFHWT